MHHLKTILTISLFALIINAHAQAAMTLKIGTQTYRCSIGKAGIIPAQNKKEGDNTTPAGNFPIRPIVFYNAEKLSRHEILQIEHMKTKGFKVIKLTDNDIWVDDPKSSYYNQWVKLNTVNTKQIASYEKLKRNQDDVYNIIVPIGYNDNPITTGKGSAIFIHIARDEYKPTAGCIALKKQDLLKVLQQLTSTSRINISVKSNQINLMN